MSLDTALSALLNGSAAVRAIIGGRYSHQRVPDNTPMPYATWHLITEAPNHAMGADAAYRESRIQVSAFGQSAREARDVAEAIRSALSRYSGTIGGTVIQDILADTASDQELPEAGVGVYHRVSDYRVFHE